jgi:hypothetical protein
MTKTNGGKEFVVRSEGIFHGIPTFPDSTKGLRAMIVGASGTSGQPLIDVLGANPQRWSHVYALSRKPPESSSPNIVHVPTDLSWDPEKLCEVFKKHKVQT